MDTSARLGLAYLAPGQLQKHVTLNETLTRLDALIQTRVVSRSQATQPADPDDGDLHILPEDPTGTAWAGFEPGDLVRFEAGGWSRVEAAEGGVAFVADEAVLVVRAVSGWIALGATLGDLQGLALLGLNTTADAGNPFAARVNKALWTALTVADGGDGDLRMTLNKEGGGDVGSLLFQSGWSGRAELGLIGDDDLTLKVSPDGSTWKTALSVDRTTGQAVFPLGSGRSETTIMTASGTWTPPAWARRIEVLAVAGSGGGGSGAAGASGSPRYGGGGGGAGGVATARWNRADLGSSLSISLGAGGAGGASVTSGAGLDGANGAVTSLASGATTLLAAQPGLGGKGGNATSGAGSAGGSGSPSSNPGGGSRIDAASGTGGSTQRPDGGGGGGGGGGLDSANTVRNGGAGGQGGVGLTPASGGAGGAGAAGSAGAAPVSPALSWPGGGGGGGAASTGTGHAGGAGAVGGGGGGGGAGVSASGAGGVGGAGLVILTAIG